MPPFFNSTHRELRLLWLLISINFGASALTLDLFDLNHAVALVVAMGRAKKIAQAGLNFVISRVCLGRTVHVSRLSELITWPSRPVTVERK